MTEHKQQERLTPAATAVAKLIVGKGSTSEILAKHPTPMESGFARSIHESLKRTIVVASYRRELAECTDQRTRTIEGQGEEIQHFLDVRFRCGGYELHEFADQTCCGGDGDRPGFTELIASSCERPFDYIVAVNLSHLVETMEMAGALLLALHSSKIGLLLVREPEQLLGHPDLDLLQAYREGVFPQQGAE